MHDGAGKCCIRTRLQDDLHIRLLHRRAVVDVDNDNLRAPLFARLHRMGHHVDLGCHRVRAPDHHAVGFRHFARIGSTQSACSQHIACPGHIRADGTEEAGIALGMAKTFDRIALHLPHGSGIEIRPDCLAAVLGFGFHEGFRNLVQCSVPGDLLPAAVTFCAYTSFRRHEAVGVIEPFRIASDLGADDACRVAIGVGTAHASDPAIIGQINVQRAGRGTVMRTDSVSGGIFECDRGRNVHVFPIGHAKARRKRHLRCIKSIEIIQQGLE